MPVFVEKFILPMAVALVVALIAGTNPMGFDWTQRISGGLAITFAAFFISHTLYKEKTPEPAPPVAASNTVAETKIPESAKQNPERGQKSLQQPSRSTPPATEERKIESPKLENKKPEAPNTTIDRSVRIGPNSKVTNSPIVTGDGNVILSGPEAINSRNYYDDFPKQIKDTLAANRKKLIKIFSESGNKEAGDYALSVNTGLAADSFQVRSWPDSRNGFGSTKGISPQPLFFETDLPDFESVKSSSPVLSISGVKVIDINPDRVILWIGKRE